ncbi:pyrimidine 5'-nucleotidase [bacterium]|nr:pyrimidine 5'-nucleotidase [bacterium]MBT7088586.1 pyrimidine 5'-nucleotidase [bacterium]
MKKTKKYELILFDADDTLFDYKASEEITLKATLAKYKAQKNDHHSYYLRYKQINHQMWQKFSQNQITLQELRTTRYEILLAQEPHINIVDFSEDYVKKFAECSHLLENAWEICSYLKQNYKIGIVTNGITYTQKIRLKNSALYPLIDFMIIAEEVGISKPNPKIFEIACQKAGHQNKNTIIMIGDSLECDIQGGIDFGIDTCWMNPEKTKNATKHKPNYEISNLKELLNFL